MTVDIDIVHETSDENAEALLEALDGMNARYRGHGDRVLRPKAESLTGTDHHLLVTEYGPLDVLGAIEHGLTFTELLDDAVDMSLEDGHIHVLTLTKYVELKEESNLEKDRARLPLLRETLRMQDEDSTD